MELAQLVGQMGIVPISPVSGDGSPQIDFLYRGFKDHQEITDVSKKR